MKKLFNKKGFTLMEMMIVIAIIVILVAISIPTFSGSLEKANKATDAANFRAARASHLTQKMNGEFEKDKTYFYDYKQGKFVLLATGVDTTKSQGSCTNHSDNYIQVQVDSNGVVGEVEWNDGTYKTDCE